VEDVDPDANDEDSASSKDFDVGAEEFDTDNSNAEVGVESSCERYEFVSIRGVGFWFFIFFIVKV
jgi:hypothetical protein